MKKGRATANVQRIIKGQCCERSHSILRTYYGEENTEQYPQGVGGVGGGGVKKEPYPQWREV